MARPPPLETLHPFSALDCVVQDLLIVVEEVPEGHDHLVGLRVADRDVAGVSWSWRWWTSKTFPLELN